MTCSASGVRKSRGKKREQHGESRAMTRILDTSAVLALLRHERGSAQVAAALPEALMSAVNAAELMRVLVRGGASPADARRVFARLDLSVIPFSEQDVPAVAEMANLTPRLSLGDCACLALGKRMGTEVLTADRAWASLELGVPVRLIR
jgi:ribonuclease VapC